MNTHTTFLNSPKMENALNALRTNPGHSEASFRQLVEQYAASLTRGEATPEGIPEVLAAYIDKVVLYAYKVTDKDVQQLKDAGYSEDYIYEITLCASVATSLARVECGLQALAGENHAVTNS